MLQGSLVVTERLGRTEGPSQFARRVNDYLLAHACLLHMIPLSTTDFLKALADVSRNHTFVGLGPTRDHAFIDMPV